MATTYYPPVSFYFAVKISGIASAGDTSFAEVDGLEAEMGVTEIKEGGENRFSHRVPDRRSNQGKLTLKRGVLLASSDLAKWCKSTIESDFSTRVETRNIQVSLLDYQAAPLLVWNFTNAWPVKWSVSGLDAKKNEIVLETLEFCYSYCQRGKESSMALNQS